MDEATCRGVPIFTPSPPPPIESSSQQAPETFLTPGQVHYFHYGVAGSVDDRGWGCGYRTLQTISAYISQRKTGKAQAPSLPDIQSQLVRLKDKPESFLGSREWIGTFEAFLVIDDLFDVPCKILHASPNAGGLRSLLPQLQQHFDSSQGGGGCPGMIGGDADAASKCVLGVSGDSLLIADPHFWNGSISDVTLDNWITWKNVDTDFCDSSMYNVCLPQLPL